jgi:uncharacterized protein YhbP (UPF0306 family)
MGGVNVSVVRVSNPAGRRVAKSARIAADARASVLRILGDNGLCSIATVSAGARPHVSTAYYCVSPTLELYFLSHPSSVHCRNLAARPAAAVAVFSSSQRWGGRDRGLQLFGSCGLATGPRAAEADRLYRARFPRFASWREGLSPGEVASEYRFYRFVTRRLKLLDEETLGDALSVEAVVRRGRRG